MVPAGFQQMGNQPSSSGPSTPNGIFIRLNQLGYLPNAAKVAIVISQQNLQGDFSIQTSTGEKPVFSAPIGQDRGTWGNFSHHYVLDFSPLTQAGIYRLSLPDGPISPSFSISSDIYHGLASMSLKFFTLQRAKIAKQPGRGTAVPDETHSPISGSPNQYLDAQGGWYDAGDVMKFTVTTSYATTALLLAYQQAPNVFHPGSNFPGSLPGEAQAGLEWLERMWNPQQQMLYVQVGSVTSHYQPYTQTGSNIQNKNRTMPVYPSEAGKGANLAGKTAAAFALAAQIYGNPASPIYDASKADHYKQIAEAIYKWGQDRPASQPTYPAYLYDEKTWQDDMALAGLEIYKLTGNSNYLQDSLAYMKSFQPLDWFDWGNLEGMDMVELARIDPSHKSQAVKFLDQSLQQFQTSARVSPWRLVHADNLVWGSLYQVMGAVWEANWYQELSGKTTYQDLAQEQIDFLFGRNPWGMSFLIGAGDHWPQHPHHHLNAAGRSSSSIELLGAWVGGPVKASVYDYQKIKLSGPDPLAKFQSPKAVYHDDVQDYVTNEPSIALNAIGVLLMAELEQGSQGS